MLRRISGLVLALFVLVGCSGDSATDVAESDAELAVVDDDQLDDALSDEAASDDSGAGRTTTTVPPRAAFPPPSRPAFDVVDGITEFNTAIRLPSLWGVRDSGDPFDGGGISFYRFAPDATTVAMAVSNSCAQLLLDIEPGEIIGPTELWRVVRIVDIESTCDTSLTETFAVGDELLIDVLDQHAIWVGTTDVALFAAMFESFSDQGDPRRDPAGAVEGRTSAFFG